MSDLVSPGLSTVPSGEKKLSEAERYMARLDDDHLPFSPVICSSLSSDFYAQIYVHNSYVQIFMCVILMYTFLSRNLTCFLSVQI